MDSSAAFWRVLGTLGDSPRKSGSGYEARCPAHEDRHASLSVGIGLDGRVLLNCHAGCPVDKVLGALGLSLSDLFERSAAGNPVRRFRLLDPSGTTVATHVREDLPGDKKLWWESHGKAGLNGTPLANLPFYRLPDVLVADVARPVVVCEGEKAADALADLGLLAVGTVTGASSTPGPEVIATLRGRPVWLWPDNDKVGREHMQRIARMLHELGTRPRWIEWKDAPEHGDAADYVVQGGIADGVQSMLKVEHRQPTDVYIGDMAELQHKVLPEPRWAVPGIFPEGVVLLVGKSKLGKSWFALDVALAIAAGAKAWGEIQVEQGEVLYLALEDSERRLQDRVDQIYGSPIRPATFLYAINWPRANEGGLELVLEWLNTHARARLVIIDVLGKFRPREANNRRLYDMDYDAIAPIADLARQRGVCVLILHHANKLKPEDPIDSVSGTTGLAGAADAICIFRRERGKVDASLLITGRDVEEQELAFKFVLSGQCGHAWELAGDAAALRISAERQEIIDVVTSQPALTPAEIADAVGRSRGSVRYLLFRMVHEGQIRCHENRYFPPSSFAFPSTPSNNANSSVSGAKTEIKTSHFPVRPPSLTGPNGALTDTPDTPISADSADSTDSSDSSVSEVRHSAQTSPNSQMDSCLKCGVELISWQRPFGYCYACTPTPYKEDW